MVVELDSLTPNPDNPKSISRKHLDRLKNSLQELGYIMPILVNQNLRVIDGHQRIKALKEQGIERVEVRMLDLDEERELLALLATDQTYGEFDRAKRQDIINALEARGARLDVLADYFASKREDTERGMEGMEPKPIPVPTIQYGDVIQLGMHYMICGDSKDPEIVKKVRAIGNPSLIVTSPPYYNQREEYATWDNIGLYLKDMSDIFRLQCEGLQDITVFCNIGGDLAYNLPAKFDVILENAGLSFLEQIAWVKSNLNMNIPRFKQIRSHKLYYPAFQWEPCYVYRRGEAKSFDPNDTNYIHENFLSNVWKFTTVRDEKRWHPAPFPIELAKTAIQCYSNKSDIILDPFLGSGTTLFAGQDCGRVVIGIELSSEYCDRIVQEWNDRYGSTSGHEQGEQGPT